MTPAMAAAREIQLRGTGDGISEREATEIIDRHLEPERKAAGEMLYQLRNAKYLLIQSSCNVSQIEAAIEGYEKIPKEVHDNPLQR